MARSAVTSCLAIECIRPLVRLVVNSGSPQWIFRSCAYIHSILFEWSRIFPDQPQIRFLDLIQIAIAIIFLSIFFSSCHIRVQCISRRWYWWAEWQEWWRLPQLSSNYMEPWRYKSSTGIRQRSWQSKWGNFFLAGEGWPFWERSGDKNFVS